MAPSLRTLVGVLLSTVVLGLSYAAAAPATAEPAPEAQPTSTLRVEPTGLAQGEKVLPAPRRGAAAVKALGSKLSAVATRNDVTPARLRTLLTNDSSAWVSTEGRVFFAESPDGRHGSGFPVAGDIAPATFPLDETFELHSKPGSDKTIYLDFNGGSLSASGFGSAWIKEVGGYKAGSFTGFSLDSSPSSFSDLERAYIQGVYRIVAEKFAAFDVDVTTQSVAADKLNRSSEADTTYGTQLVFTDDGRVKPASVCPRGCTGIAYLGSFNAVVGPGSDQEPNTSASEPAWVYTHTMKSSPVDAANTAAHEAGHNLGLLHDGETDPESEYYDGHGNWFPIMGSSLRAVGQFSKGEYDGASNHEDDLAKMQTFGLAPRTDDWGDADSPSSLGQQNRYQVTGVIENAADQDVFTIERTCAANIRATAHGIGEGQALDIKLSILDSAGTTVLASDDPLSSQDADNFPDTALPLGLDAEAVTSSPPPAGTYRIQVDGVGARNPATTGYSDYGSIGGYTLSVSGCAGSSGATPDAPTSASISAAQKSTSAILMWDGPSTSGDGFVTGYRISGIPGGPREVATDSVTLTRLVPGVDYKVRIAALNQFGAGPASVTNLRLNTWAPTSAPTMTAAVIKDPQRGNRPNMLDIGYYPPANPGNARFTKWRITINGQNFDNVFGQYSGIRISGFGNGTFTAKLTIYSTSDYGGSNKVSPSTSKTFSVGASAPRIGKASSGAKGKPVTVTARWAAPVHTRGLPITRYKVLASKIVRGKITKQYITGAISPKARSYVVRWLPPGSYKLRVLAYNAIGEAPISGFSKVVVAK